MIKISIIKSNDPHLDADYTSSGNIFVIGKSKKSNLIVDLESFASIAFTLKVKNDNVLIKPHTNEPYLINKKKIKGSKVCTVGSIISIPELTFKIEKIQFDESENYSELAKKVIEKFNDQMPEESKYLLDIQETLVSIEKAINDSR